MLFIDQPNLINRVISKLVAAKRPGISVITPPLLFADGRPLVYGEGLFRRCWQRNLPFLPGPRQVLVKNLSN